MIFLVSSKDSPLPSIELDGINVEENGKLDKVAGDDHRSG